MTLTAQQLDARRIGGSDAGPACGVETFGRNRVSLWKELTGQIDRSLPDNRQLRRGRELEAWIAKEYAIERGVEIRRRNATLSHPKYPFMTAHLDRVVVGEKRLVECKSVHPLASKGWGEPGSDEVPNAYLCQVHHYLIVTGYQIADLAAMFGDRLAIYTIRANRELHESIIDREADLWSHVQNGEPPDPMTVGEVLDLYPRDNGQEIAATNEIVESWQQLVLARAWCDEWEEKKKALEATLKIFMGERGILLDGKERLATWFATKSSGTDWKGLAELLLTKRTEARRARFIKRFERAGIRKFLVKDPKK